MTANFLRHGPGAITLACMLLASALQADAATLTVRVSDKNAGQTGTLTGWTLVLCTQ